MKKFILLLFLGFASLSYSHEFEARVAYFTPVNSRIKKNYGNDGVEYAIEATTPLKPYLMPLRRYDLFGNIGYYRLDSREHSRMQTWTLVAGLKRYYGAIDACCRPYLGVGWGAVHIDLHNNALFKKQSSQWGHAFLAKSGIKFNMPYSFILDLFVDYSYHKYRSKRDVDHEEHNVNTGAWIAGLGLGYQY